jgi:hypothetical protein
MAITSILSQNLIMQLARSHKSSSKRSFRMHLVPCSCGTTLAVSADYDRNGTTWSRYLTCPSCGKRHDPKNRLLELGYHNVGYWKVDGC